VGEEKLCKGVIDGHWPTFIVIIVRLRLTLIVIEACD
jgi:hypothetical protein